MRRLFWCGMALIMAMTAGLYTAADYARHNPGSCLARCACTAYDVYNPITAAIAGRLPTTADGRAPAVSSRRGPRPAQVQRPQAHDSQHPCSGLLSCPDAHDQGSQILTSIDADAPDVTVAAVAVEESEDNGATMPLSRDDDDDAPSLMPPLDDGGASARLLNFWMDLVRVAAAPARNDQQPATSAPVGSSEESEPGYSGGAADCREDPASPFQYPGCPHTAACPAGRCPRPTAKPQQLAPKVMGDLDEPNPLPDLLGPQRAPLDAEPQAGTAEDTPLHPDVDTMEFRHSDAHEGEFDSRPM